MELVHPSDQLIEAESMNCFFCASKKSEPEIFNYLTKVEVLDYLLG